MAIMIRLINNSSLILRSRTPLSDVSCEVKTKHSCTCLSLKPQVKSTFTLDLGAEHVFNSYSRRELVLVFAVVLFAFQLPPD